MKVLVEASVLVIGLDNCGKTTLLHLLGGLRKPKQGEILIDGKDTRQLSSTALDKFRGKNIGIVFQDHKLLMNRTVFDNVALPMRVESVRENDIKRRVSAALDKTGLLDKAKSYPMQLSGGEQQRVGIARAVVNKPMLLLADEPTGNLDPQLSRQVFNLFAEFNRVGVSVLMASHDLSLIGGNKYRRFDLHQG